MSMERLTIVICGFALLGVGLVYAAPVSLTGAHVGTPEAEEETLHFDVEFNDTFLAADPAAMDVGDRIILSDLLPANGQEVGRSAGVCTVANVAGEAICSVVYALPDGTIATEFFNTPPPVKEFAIAGGTGRYQGVRGFGELVESGTDETGTVTFHVID